MEHAPYGRTARERVPAALGALSLALLAAPRVASAQKAAPATNAAPPASLKVLVPPPLAPSVKAFAVTTSALTLTGLALATKTDPLAITGLAVEAKTDPLSITGLAVAVTTDRLVLTGTAPEVQFHAPSNVPTAPKR
ncbi:MAG TPA: hypothetical protein VMN04_00320 [Thermoanaerobaculia bacterium]|nr:hypothetical protein [Thermoanaerobaculia bacterium]